MTLANTSGALLNLDSFSQTLGSLNGGGASGGNVTLGSGTLTTGALNTADSYGGVISGTGGGLVKAGVGTLTLSGANTYTGVTTVNAGKLLLDHGALTTDDYFASSGIAIASGATFEINQTDGSSRYSNITKAVTGAGLFSKTGAGEINLANDPSTITTFKQLPGGLINVQEGTLSYFNTHADNKGSLTIASGATARLDNAAQGENGYFDALNGSGNLSYASGSALRSITLGTSDGSGTFSGTLSDGGTGAVSLIKTGTGIQTFSGENTYTGGTTISVGTLQVSNGKALGTGVVNNNATLDIGSTTLNIGGTYTQSEGAATMLEVAVNGSSSGSIDAAGKATVHADNSLVPLPVTN
jgi:autotransporter-associated beta strand protein